MKINNRKYMILCLGLVCFFAFFKNISAANIVDIRFTGIRENLPIAAGGTYGMKLYESTLSGQNLMTYCLDAGRTYAGDGSYNITHVIDASDDTPGSQWYSFDVAATYAYQYMQANGYATSTTDNRIIGELVFRWITEAFASNGCGPTCGSQLRPAYNLFRMLTVGFNKSDWRVAKAIEIYDKASQLALKNYSYDTLISNGFSNDANGIWGVKWSVKTFTNSPISSDQNQIYIELTPQNTTIDRINYDNFSVSFTNESIKNNIISQSSAKVSDGVVSLTVTFNKGTWDGKDPGVIVQASYCSSLNASSQLYMVAKQSYNQRMLIVLPGDCSNPNVDNPHGGSRVEVDSNDNESCMCDTTTGTWTYQKFKDGNRIEYATWKETDPNFNEMMQKYQGKGCPTTCSKAPDKHVCEIVDGEHYCEDGEPCDEDEYIKDCLCNPVVTIPSDCNDFDTESTQNGYISDIATNDKNCNSSNVVDQIKKCIIDNTDARDESFEATNELNGNPYCKVWCSESYDFELPTAQYSTSGGYFTLSTTINGKRDCYISSADDPTQPIDEAKFNEDLEKAQNEVINAYNEYAKWKSAAATKAESEIKNGSAPGNSCGPGSSPSCTSCSGDNGSVTVYTKEWEWIAYRKDGSKYINKESYSSGSISCDTCSCTESEGDDPDESGGTYHAQNRDNALATLKEKINNLNSIIAQYNSCTGAIANNKNSDLASVDASSTNSSSWDNDMQFNPTVDFTYNQDYINQMSGSFEQVDNSSNSEYMYCSGDTNDKYECLSGKSSNIATTNKSVLTCDDGGCSWKNFNVSTAKWIRKTKTNSADYQVAERFSTYTQYGTIKVQEGSDNDYLWTSLPEGSLPVSLITKTGVFPFKFTFGNIGQSNSISGANGLGRLIDNENSNSITVDVLTKYNELDSKYKCDGGSSSTTDGGYVCHYLNNCPGCDFTCDDDDNCEFDDCDGGYCILECPNCVFDGEKSNFSYRTVSLNNLFPNDRDPGYNWDSNINEKAKKTMEEIANTGEKIYETPQYSYTLTPSNLQKIREYNDQVVSYTNSTVPSNMAIDNEDSAIYCEKYTINGKTYNVKCKSRFLDIIENSKYKNVYVQSNSITRNEEWTLYDGVVDGKIGPAWK